MNLESRAHGLLRQSIGIKSEEIARQRRSEALKLLRRHVTAWIGDQIKAQVYNVDQGRITKIAPRVVIIPPI